MAPDPIEPARAADSGRPSPLPPGLDFVWAEGIRLIDAQLRSAAELDSKIAQWLALTTAGAVLVLNAVLNEPARWLQLVLIEMGTVLAFLVLAYAQRDFAYAPAFPALVTWTAAPPGQIRGAFLGNLEQAYLRNLDSYSIKALYLRLAVSATALVGATIVVGALWSTS